MSDTEPSETLPPSLRLLKWLVITLTLVMIGGVITTVGLLVTRFPKPVTAPEALQLPAGAVPTAITQAQTYWVVVTEDDRMLFFNSDGSLRGEIDLPE